MREVFKEYFNNTLRNVKLQGIVEIDESLFGRRVKYQRQPKQRIEGKLRFLNFICLTCTYFTLSYLLQASYIIYIEV